MPTASFRRLPPSTRAAAPRHAVAALALAGLLATAGPASAEVFSVEGPLESVDVLTGTIRCNGATIRVVPRTVISSPTATLTLQKLAHATPFPNSGFNPMTGTARQGFVGGSCIVDGDDATGERVADTVFVEVAENVQVGTVSAQPFAINGVQVVPLTDARMPATKPAAGFHLASGSHANGMTEVARNDFGFGVKPETVPVGDLSSAEGYLGTDGRLYAHTIETTGGTALSTVPRASIRRAQCRNEAGTTRDQVEVRGGCVLPAGATAASIGLFARNAAGQLVPLMAGTRQATATCTRDPAAPAFGLYRFTANVTLPDNACPSQIGAQLTQQGVAPAAGLFDFANTDAR